MAATNTQNKQESNNLGDLIGPTDPAQDRMMRDRLIQARVSLLMKASFFGNLATRLKLVNADEWCSTAATDGRNFYYNSRFIAMLRPGELEFLFGHEVLHCVYDHLARCGDRIPKVFNIANDFCVNADLKKHRIGTFITTVPCLYDIKYENWSSEEIYDDLMKNAEKINIDDLFQKLLDEHIDGGGDDQEKQGGSKRPKLSEKERQEIYDEIKEAVLSAAQTCEAGSLPANVRRMIQELTEPKLNWRELLRQQLESSVKSDFTWMRPSRRNWHMDAIMPGMDRDTAIDICVMLDASGSISDTMLRDFMAEVAGIMEQFGNYRIHVATFDTTVFNPQDYTSDNLEDISEYEITGGGGTDFECIFSYLKQAEIEPKRLVVFTDGYPFGSWGDENYADTLWILHGTTSIVPPWGQYAYYEEQK